MAQYVVTRPHGRLAKDERVDLTDRQARFLRLGGFVKPAPATRGRGRKRGKRRNA